MAGIPKIGKRGRRNIKINAFLNRTAETMGLADHCELRIARNKKGELICTGGLNTGWAHAKRRPKWTTERDQFNVVRACTDCHNYAQHKGNEENEQIILAAIDKRGWSFADLKADLVKV